MKTITSKDMFKFATPKNEHAQNNTFHGVHYGKGYMVATDAHILAAVKSEYDESLEGKTIDRNGDEIKGKFPDFNVLDWRTEGHITLKLTKDDINIIKSLYKKYKNNCIVHLVDNMWFNIKRLNALVELMQKTNADTIYISKMYIFFKTEEARCMFMKTIDAVSYYRAKFDISTDENGCYHINPDTLTIANPYENEYVKFDESL